MKVTVIYGSPRKGTTYEAVRIVKEEMQKMGEVEFAEFHLPQDVPAFCKGCFQCIVKSEHRCPDAKFVQPIVDSMLASDGFIISSPVYVMQISGGLKAFFDHLAYCYLNHRPRFFKQKALVITTTAGAGIKNCNRYITQNLSFWGVNKVYSYGQAVMAIDWEGIPEKIKVKFTGRLKGLAKTFYEDVDSKRYHAPSFLQSIMFHAGRSLALQSDDASADKQYWKQKQWLDKQCDYYLEDVNPGILKKATGKLLCKLFGLMLGK